MDEPEQEEQACQFPRERGVDGSVSRFVEAARAGVGATLRV